ncbi:DUF6221 family protein [Streptomyces sp. NPDC000880]
MSGDLVSFLRARLNADEHEVVYITSRHPKDPDVVLGSTVPMLDMVNVVINRYAEAAGDDGTGLSRGRKEGLGLAVRLIAQAYHEHPDYRSEWRP